LGGPDGGGPPGPGPGGGCAMAVYIGNTKVARHATNTALRSRIASAPGSGSASFRGTYGLASSARPASAAGQTLERSSCSSFGAKQLLTKLAASPVPSAASMKSSSVSV